MHHSAAMQNHDLYINDKIETEFKCSIRYSIAVIQQRLYSQDNCQINGNAIRNSEFKFMEYIKLNYSFHYHLRNWCVILEYSCRHKSEILSLKVWPLFGR